MDTDDQRYLGDQMEMFPQGFEHLHLEINVHFRVRGDSIAVGYILRDGLTDEWIASQVPVGGGYLCNVDLVADEIKQLVQSVRDRLEPFP